MGSTNLGPITIIFFFYVISNLQSMVHCINNIQELDDQIRSYAARVNKGRHTGSLYELSLPTNLTDVKASVVTVRNSIFWRKGANFSGVYIPPMVKTLPYSKRIALVYETLLGDYSSSVYFRLADNYSFISPVIGFTAYDATNTNDLKPLNLSIERDDPILIKFDPYISNHHQSRGIKCVALGDNELLSFSNTTRNYSCATTNSRGHYALVVALNQKHKQRSKLELARRRWWWVALTIIGVSVLLALVVVGVVKLVRKKRFKEMERESEKSEMVGNIWIGQSRMPAATMVRTQPCLEYHEDFPSS